MLCEEQRLGEVVEEQVCGVWVWLGRGWNRSQALARLRFMTYSHWEERFDICIDVF